MTSQHFNIETTGTARTSRADTFAKLTAKGKPGHTRRGVHLYSNEASR